MLTEQEKQKIREEEALRKQIRGNTPVDWLSSCILAPVILIGAIVAIALLFAMAFIFSGIWHGTGH